MLGISIIFCYIFSLRVHLFTYPQKHARWAGGGGGVEGVVAFSSLQRK